ncbi:hypothetical protein EVG20_g8258 [Dentipellis fragilis]|uniref:Uncharacterized protein n=1 Tax=Dentipellis fragilis TaxID=205917 RepID=A0A4Y9Y6L5_9AGAM|nr:hypothetical protein EVG20_g8258 [Dentipellis fragilis]
MDLDRLQAARDALQREAVTPAPLLAKGKTEYKTSASCALLISSRPSRLPLLPPFSTCPLSIYPRTRIEMAHYSSLFTWGLLSERATPSPPTSPKLFSKFRKTSLPSASIHESASAMYTLDSEADAEDLPPPEWNSAFFFSVRDGRGSAELRSFLSLDLAESQSMRSAKHRRAESHDVQPVTFTMPAPVSAPLFQPVETLSPTHRASPLPPPSPSSSSSRRVDQYRNTETLPPARRVSPLPPSSPAGSSSYRSPSRNLSSLPPSPADLSLHYPQHTNASPHSPARNFSPLPPSPAASSTRRPSRDSLRHLPSPKPAPNTTLPQIPSPTRALPQLPQLNTTIPLASSASSASSSPWISHRSTLSAPSILPPPSPTPSSCLIPSPVAVAPTQRFSFASGATSVRTPSKRIANRSDALACLEGRDRARYRRRNFMNLSDDEDEADVEDELDDVHTRAPSLRAPPPTPMAVKPSPVKAKPRTRSRRGTADSWFPFANFIDLRDDDLPSWRSFIEIASTAHILSSPSFIYIYAPTRIRSVANLSPFLCIYTTHTFSVPLPLPLPSPQPVRYALDTD